MHRPTLFRGGRVIDPETGLDALRDVLVENGRIAAVVPGGEPAAVGLRVRDVTGLVVAPGFIDVHSHTDSLDGQWLQLHDGVTTVLELELGALPVRHAAGRAVADGAATNVGFSASWAVARMKVLAGVDPRGRFADFTDHVGDQAWQRPASRSEVDRILDLLDEQLHAGGIGIGVLAGYAPYFGPDEYQAVARLASARDVPVFTHVRDLRVHRPDTPVDGAEEIVRAARETGARMHFCHVNSSAGRHVPQVLDLVGRAQADGAPLTIEGYPYGAGMTTIGAEFLDADGLARRGLRATDLTLAATGERVPDLDRLAELRRETPGALVQIDILDEGRPSQLSLLLEALTHPGALIASDAMPLVMRPGRVPSWPLPDDTRTHPRTAGTFTKAIRLLHREAGHDLASVLARATIIPARLLESAVPSMRRKGRLQVGCDADLVVFDATAVTDLAGYDRPSRPAAGMSHVMVAGDLVVDDGVLLPDVRAGRWIASEIRT